MTLIRWNDQTLSVGVELIDNQHKMLIHLINQLAMAVENSSVENKEDHQTIAAIFSQLQDYTKYHFDTEETYFFRLNNHDTELHIQQHDQFINQLHEFAKQHQDFSIFSSQLLEFLSDWLINHIQVEDKKFIELHHHS